MIMAFVADTTTTTTPVTTVPPFNASCLSNQFRCEMGFCIDDSLICDGADDCGDASDERSCGKGTITL